MEKDREQQDGTGNSASRRDFLYQAAGVGLVVAAGLMSQAGFAEAAPRSRRRASGRTSTDTPANAGAFRIVSDLPYRSPKPGEAQHYLTLGVDSQNHIVLDEEKEGYGQVWEVLSDDSGGGQIRRAQQGGGGYLALDGAGGLTLSDKPAEAVRWWWKDRDTKGYLYIQLSTDATKVIHAEVKDNKLPGTVSLAQRSATPGYLWKIVPAQDKGLPEGPQRPTEVTFSHVPDTCDSKWHNPACPGNPATWTGCTLNGAVCKCTHA